MTLLLLYKVTSSKWYKKKNKIQTSGQIFQQKSDLAFCSFVKFIIKRATMQIYLGSKNDQIGRDSKVES